MKTEYYKGTSDLWKSIIIRVHGDCIQYYSRNQKWCALSSTHWFGKINKDHFKKLTNEEIFLELL